MSIDPNDIPDIDELDEIDDEPAYEPRRATQAFALHFDLTTLFGGNCRVLEVIIADGQVAGFLTQDEYGAFDVVSGYGKGCYYVNEDSRYGGLRKPCKGSAGYCSRPLQGREDLVGRPPPKARQRHAGANVPAAPEAIVGSIRWRKVPRGM